jgi:anti-sigma regulatory factor (Ser/Thr protein kinase)
MSSPTPPAPATWPFHLRLLSDPAYLCAVRAAVESLARRAGFPDRDAGEIVLAVDETLTNMIRHGYRGRADGPIDLRIDIHRSPDATSLLIDLQDESGPVDPAAIKPPVKSPDQPGGLGVLLIRNTMDQALYARRPDQRGLQVTLTRSHPRCPQAPAMSTPTQGTPHDP